MKKSAVEAVLINWKRPQNVARIVEVLSRQTVPCTITVCDCHPSPEFRLSPEAHSKIDRVHRLEENFGPYSRYVPWASYDHEFTYFVDDDMVPGRRCLEHFLGHASSKKVGVLGQDGRRLASDGVYRTNKVRRSLWLEEVDLVVRAYFVRTCHLSFLEPMERELGLCDRSAIEDDILLAVALQLKARVGSYFTPRSFDRETSISVARLPAPHALSGRADHMTRRTELLAKAGQVGWRPLRERPTHFERWVRALGS